MKLEHKLIVLLGFAIALFAAPVLGVYEVANAMEMPHHTTVQTSTASMIKTMKAEAIKKQDKIKSDKAKSSKVKAKSKTLKSKIVKKSSSSSGSWYAQTARITTYCPCCNSPNGYQSSSGKTLSEGDIACNWLPMGTKVKIFGQIYTVVDICGTDAIDIFKDTSTCECNLNTTTTVYIQK